jgi:hypothetical protein
MSFVFCSGSNLIITTASRLVTFSHIKKIIIFVPVERVARGVCSAGYCREIL